jgi:hypothetical protein
LCPGCATGNIRLKLSPANRALAEKLKEWPLERSGVLKASHRASRDILRITLQYLEQTLEHPLKTLPYYLQVVPAS